MLFFAQTRHIYKTVQLFEKGYICTSAENETQKVFALRNADGSYALHPQPTSAYPEFYGDQVDIVTVNNVAYVNYQYGYVKATLSNGAYTYEYHYGRRIDAEGTVTKCSADDLWGKVSARNKVNPAFASEVTALVPAGEQPAMLEAFETAYKQGVENGVIAGLPSNEVYVFNGVLIQNYWHGNGSAKNGTGDAECYILYDTVGKKAHIVAQVAAKWLSLASDCGTVISDYGNNTFKLNGETVTKANSQLFVGGFIVDGAFTAAIYDSKNNNYLTAEGRNVPGVYGAVTSLEEVDGVYYINYEYGVLKLERLLSRLGEKVLQVLCRYVPCRQRLDCRLHRLATVVQRLPLSRRTDVAGEPVHLPPRRDDRSRRAYVQGDGG